MNCYAENMHVYFQKKTLMKYVWNKYIYIQIIRITVCSKNNYITIYARSLLRVVEGKEVAYIKRVYSSIYK